MTHLANTPEMQQHPYDAAGWRDSSQMPQICGYALDEFPCCSFGLVVIKKNISLIDLLPTIRAAPLL